MNKANDYIAFISGSLKTTLILHLVVIKGVKKIEWMLISVYLGNHYLISSLI